MHTRDRRCKTKMKDSWKCRIKAESRQKIVSMKVTEPGMLRSHQALCDGRNFSEFLNARY